MIDTLMTVLIANDVGIMNEDLRIVNASLERIKMVKATPVKAVRLFTMPTVFDGKMRYSNCREESYFRQQMQKNTFIANISMKLEDTFCLILAASISY